MDQQINVTVSELETINISVAEEQPINIQISDGGGAGHTHADPLATTRVMTYVPEFKAYEIVE